MNVMRRALILLMSFAVSATATASPTSTAPMAAMGEHSVNGSAPEWTLSFLVANEYRRYDEAARWISERYGLTAGKTSAGVAIEDALDPLALAKIVDTAEIFSNFVSLKPVARLSRMSEDHVNNQAQTDKAANEVLEEEFRQAAFTRILDTASIPARLLAGRRLADAGEPFNTTDFIISPYFAGLLEAGISEDLEFLFYAATEGILLAASLEHRLVLASPSLGKACFYQVPRHLGSSYAEAGFSPTPTEERTPEFREKVRQRLAETLDSSGWVPILKYGFENRNIGLDLCSDYPLRKNRAEPAEL